MCLRFDSQPGLVTKNDLVYEIESWIMLFCHGYGGRSCGKEQDET